MKKTIPFKSFIAAAACLFLAACDTSSVVGTSEQIANAVLPVAATVYGGGNAGTAAQNALYSLEAGLNPLVGQPAPALSGMTGTTALDTAIINSGLIKPGNKITVEDIQTIDAAAQIAPLLATAVKGSTSWHYIDNHRVLAKWTNKHTGAQCAQIIFFGKTTH